MTGAEIHLLRLLGACGGAIIAPSLYPKHLIPLRANAVEICCRVAVAVTSGFLLGGVWQYQFGWPNEPDLISGAACIISTCSWWAWHAIIKALEAWNIRLPWFTGKRG